MAYTKNGVPIQIGATALWTLNQSKDAMEAFYTVCFKYTCASTQDQGGSANFSTEGWNGMLAENFGPAMDVAARKAASQIDDTIWQTNNPAQYQALADGMSKAFADAMRANLGFSQDLFCGSANSSWKDPGSPGVGEFTCSPVRIVVNSVRRGQVAADESTQGADAINAQRLKNAEALYGKEYAPYVLGTIDIIKECRSAGINCIVNVGGAPAGPAIVPQTNNPRPSPVVSPAATAAATATPRR